MKKAHLAGVLPALAIALLFVFARQCFANDVVWSEDSVPAGAVQLADGKDTWNWTSNNPAPFAGSAAHQSSLQSGLHEHFFNYASTPLTVAAGETLYAYVYLDPANPPREIMLSWNADNWEHRAYWGDNLITYGTGATDSRRGMGSLPATGQWVRLSVPASQVGLEGKSITGMGFSAYGGRATWDQAGKATVPTAITQASATAPTTPPTGVTSSLEYTWYDDSVPAGAQALADGKDTWNWTSSPTPFSGSRAHQSALASGLHEHFFNYAAAPLIVKAGDVLFTYVYLDPANMPNEIMLSYNADNWEHRAYWGDNLIGYGTNATSSRRSIGALPAGGGWVRLEVAASQLGLEGQSVTGMGFSEYNGRATWDKSGVAAAFAPVTTTTSSGSGTSATGSSVDFAWSDDSVPAGAQSLSDGKDTWNWTSSPAPFSGTSAHQSANLAGLHEHFFNYATSAMSVKAGDSLYAYVYLDPASTPSEIMLSWNADGWEHRAYWGANSITYGTNGTNSRRSMGSLPAAGQWVRLEVPASQVGLEGSNVTGMGFSQYGGRATWDKTGSSTASTSTTTTSTGTTSGTTGTGSTSGTTSTGTTDTSSTGTTSGTTTTSTTTTTTDPVATTVSPTTVSPTPSTPVTDTLRSLLNGFNVDYTALQLPNAGDSILHVLSPTVLELKHINAVNQGSTTPTDWNFVNNFSFSAPSLGKFNVVVNGQSIGVKAVGFKRRVFYAPLMKYDLRLENSLYLTLSSPIADGASVKVTNPDGSLWSDATTVFSTTTDPLRFSPAIHVNQEGYVPSMPKKAMVGYYLGDMGEMPIPASAGFKVVDARSGTVMFSGALNARLDNGWQIQPTPYQQVYQADFTAFTTPGEYKLQVDGLGTSLPFLIDDGIAMGFARTYALGLYHQRSGTAEGLPFTRFTRGADHVAPAQVPSPQSDSQFAWTWSTIAGYGSGPGADDHPAQTAPLMTSEASLLYPYNRTGTVDVSGGHHDAGDYSKYTTNSAQLVHYLTFTADAIPGVSKLDNMGLPESGDGISDVLQEAKWEADYLSKIQDTDGGFYFIVYPKTREYEGNVTPDNGDSQVVWPKNTSASAAATAALADIASSPQFKAAYPALAAKYLDQAKLGWQFLMNAIAKYGKAGAYQKITFYGDHWGHDDELAWAASALYAATGDAQYQQKLFEFFPNPSDPNTFRWGWWRMSECWGNAIRDYAFAARTGRLPASALNSQWLAAAEAQIVAAGDDAASWGQKSAYGTPFPYQTKQVAAAGWYFSLDQASDMAVAYQIVPKDAYVDGITSAMNYEGGTNPVNVTYLTGIGLKRQRDVVHQASQNDRRVMPITGLPQGNIQSGYSWVSQYGVGNTNMLSAVSYPTDEGGKFPFYDRWADAFNVTTELVTVNQGRSLLSTTFLATRTATASNPWTAAPAQLNLPSTVVQVGTSVDLSVTVPGLDLSAARILWEARDQEPAFGPTYTIAPKNNGEQWVEVEIEMPDGRRSFGIGSFQANSPVVNWVVDGIPAGGQPGTGGGDNWNFVSVSDNPPTNTRVVQSNAAAGLHEHWFSGASASVKIDTGDKLFAWVYIDAAAPVSEIMLQWNDGSSWEHRAFWGGDRISYGSLNTASRYRAGDLPAIGQWVRLTVPASALGLEGKTITGMAFSQFDGRTLWGVSGKASPESGY